MLAATRKAYFRAEKKLNDDEEPPETWTTAAFEVFKHFGPAGSDEAMFRPGSRSCSAPKKNASKRKTSGASASDVAETMDLTVEGGDGEHDAGHAPRNTSRDKQRTKGKEIATTDKLHGATRAAALLADELEVSNEHVSQVAVELRKKNANEKLKNALLQRAERKEELKELIAMADTPEEKAKYRTQLKELMLEDPPTYMSPTKARAPERHDDDDDDEEEEEEEEEEASNICNGSK